MSDELEQAKASLERIQNFNPNDLDRKDELGSQLNFDVIISDTNRLVDLFKLIPLKILEDLPKNHLNQIRSQSDQIFKILSDVLNFSPSSENAAATRTGLIDQIRNQYDSVFNALFSYISYASARVTDFQNLERQGRAAVQSVIDRTGSLTEDLENNRDTSVAILADIRKVAEEHGVSQQAYYFKEASEHHSTEAETWKRNTYKWSAALIIYSFVALFAHKWSLLAPTSTYDAAQLIVGKVLLFAVISFMLFLTARNFLSHRHNSIVNKHRQNALMTFKALVDAGGTKEARDVVLKFAASSIFSPQDTGYVRTSASQGPTSSSIIEMLPSKFTSGDSVSL